LTQFDSDDEREAIEARSNLTHKIRSQSIKKSKKNQSRLPRTATLRTISELTTELTKAGLDPSRIQERAEMLAKLQGAQRKRKRGDDDVMDVDVDGEEAEGDWMDVDGEEGKGGKRTKTDSGAAVTARRREPRSNRQLAGMRDGAVSCSFYAHILYFFLHF
jgi:nucleolar GTP-binding protein